MPPYVVDFQEMDPTDVAGIGGKGAGLAALLRLGVQVPGGFCVTTDAFERTVAASPAVRDAIGRLASLADRAARQAHAASVRAAIDDAGIPADVRAAVAQALARTGAKAAYAVRSS